MSAILPFALPLFAIVLLLCAIAVIRHLGVQWQWSAEVQRKLVHVLVGLFSLTLPFLFPHAWQVISLLVMAIAAMLFMRRPTGHFSGIGAAIHSVERRSLGDIWLALAVGFLYVRSEGNYILYGLPLAIITLSDAAAALTGSAYGRRRFTADGGVKSWEGVIAFAMVGWIAAMSMLLLFSDVPRGNVILLGFIIATFGAMVEALSWRGLDNLFVPLAIHFFLKGFLFADPVTLSFLAVLFFAISMAAPLLSKALNLPPHVIRAFVVALFLFLGVGEVDGAIFPIAAMALYLVSRKGEPGDELDFLGTLCGAALIWFFLGETVGRTAIQFYIIAMAGIAMAYGQLAFAGRDRPLAAITCLILTGFAVISVAYGGVVRTAVAPPGFLPIMVSSLLSVAIAVHFQLELFRRWRAPRIALLASAIPLFAYGYSVWRF